MRNRNVENHINSLKNGYCYSSEQIAGVLNQAYQDKFNYKEPKALYAAIAKGSWAAFNWVIQKDKQEQSIFNAIKTKFMNEEIYKEKYLGDLSLEIISLCFEDQEALEEKEISEEEKTIKLNTIGSVTARRAIKNHIAKEFKLDDLESIIVFICNNKKVLHENKISPETIFQKLTTICNDKNKLYTLISNFEALVYHVMNFSDKNASILKSWQLYLINQAEIAKPFLIALMQRLSDRKIQFIFDLLTGNNFSKEFVGVVEYLINDIVNKSWHANEDKQYQFYSRIVSIPSLQNLRNLAISYYEKSEHAKDIKLHKLLISRPSIHLSDEDLSLIDIKGKVYETLSSVDQLRRIKLAGSPFAKTLYAKFKNILAINKEDKQEEGDELQHLIKDAINQQVVRFKSSPEIDYHELYNFCDTSDVSIKEHKQTLLPLVKPHLEALAEDLSMHNSLNILELFEIEDLKKSHQPICEIVSMIYYSSNDKTQLTFCAALDLIGPVRPEVFTNVLSLYLKHYEKNSELKTKVIILYGLMNNDERHNLKISEMTVAFATIDFRKNDFNSMLINNLTQQEAVAVTENILLQEPKIIDEIFQFMTQKQINLNNLFLNKNHDEMLERLNVFIDKINQTKSQNFLIFTDLMIKTMLEIKKRFSISFTEIKTDLKNLFIDICSLGNITIFHQLLRDKFFIPLKINLHTGLPEETLPICENQDYNGQVRIAKLISAVNTMADEKNSIKLKKEKLMAITHREDQNALQEYFQATLHDDLIQKCFVKEEIEGKLESKPCNNVSALSLFSVKPKKSDAITQNIIANLSTLENLLDTLTLDQQQNENLQQALQQFQEKIASLSVSKKLA